MLVTGGDGSFRICFYCCCSPKRYSVTLLLIYKDRLSDIPWRTEIACTLDSRVINNLRFATDLVMLSHSDKGIQPLEDLLMCRLWRLHTRAFPVKKTLAVRGIVPLCLFTVQLLHRVLDIPCQIDSSQCLAQLTPPRVGRARSVHVHLGASPHVIR